MCGHRNKHHIFSGVDNDEINEKKNARCLTRLIAVVFFLFVILGYLTRERYVIEGKVLLLIADTWYDCYVVESTRGSVLVSCGYFAHT